jgi:hypothetical protein
MSARGPKKTKRNPRLDATSVEATLPVPIRDGASVGESIACGFRQNMLEISDGDEKLGSLDTGAGLGSDAILMEWRGRRAILRGRELLKAWVATFAPDDAERM